MSVPPQQPSPPSRAQWKAMREQWKAQARMQRAAYRTQYYRHTRGSLVGPLLVLGIGIVALLMTTHHLAPSVFWHWYVRWWPLILIGTGCLLILESFSSSSVSRVRISGGVVVLSILLGIIGWTAAHHTRDLPSVADSLSLKDDADLLEMLGTKHEARDTVQHPLPPNATVVLQIPHGDISVTSSMDGDRVMHLGLDKKVYSDSDAEAHQKLKSLEPLITETGNLVIVHMPASEGEATDVEVTLPSSVAVQIHAGHGDVHVSGERAQVEISADQGDVHLDSIQGNAIVTMQHGDFFARNLANNLELKGRMEDVSLSQISGDVSMSGDFFGDVHLEELHRPFHLRSSRTEIQLSQLAGSLSLDGDDLNVDDAAGPVSIATHAKEITLRRTSGEVHVSNSDGGISMTAARPFGAISLLTRNGSLDLTMPADAVFSLQATADDGEINSDFPISTQMKGDSTIASGSVGNGGPLIQLAAKKGDIAIHKEK